ncbi:predicted protein [Chaetomium globosum CBS 148.51]|uniref:NlpC/P60 domain-containing protein n=1 Tax=Chaetomium globosum (strain ATCC 6205 / CBS 148.51 / DSM 1962 / NBRC 6347 / NRRL 1970) TaxID=306901 RepID=Q2H6W7_CHAGB|nr:uncharacterized protein CHGG_05598 [Chaetomium globosum CBS 148.51]EAQ88979.1 predicted protein [Chaetomium globosum CBS 148.51]
MQLTSLVLTLAAAISTVAAYPITGNDVNCRSGPDTSYKSVKTYKKGADVKLTCQTYGESINGNAIWDKTSDGCYVSDYYVKTGSNSMVTKECPIAGGGGGSQYNGPINRTEIISRGRYWVSRKVPYSMSKTYPDQQGRKYRTDCSGFWADLKPGDFVGTLGEGTAGAAGHVTLFLSWADSAHKAYNTLECRGTYGCVQYKRNVGWKSGGFTAKPYRYTRVIN